MNGSAAINLKERQTHTYRQTDRQTDRQRFEDTRRTNALGDEDENGELRHRLTMERHWKYCLIFSLIQWTKVSAIQEVCVNVQDQIVLDCSSSGGGVPEEERTITISEACLCLGCSSLCFCLKIDWDYCEGRTYCSFQLSSEELSRFRIRLSPSEIEILSLVVDSIQIKAKYSCSPAIPDKTTVVQTSRRTPLTTSWPKTTEQSTTTGSPPGTTYSVPPSEGQVKVTRSTEPDEYPVHPEDRSHGSGYGETSYTEPPVHAYLSWIIGILTLAFTTGLTVLLIFLFWKRKLPLVQRGRESTPSPEVVIEDENGKTVINQLYLSKTITLPEKY